MKSKFIIFIAVLPLLCSLSLNAQVDTRGTDFWLTFGKNAKVFSSEVDLQIRVVSGAQSTITVNMYFTGLTGTAASVSFSVSAGQVYTYPLNDVQKKAVYNETTGTSNKSIHITTSAPVSVYALNQLIYTTDATNVLPISALGTDYYQISYPTLENDAYAIVATQDGTEIYHNGTKVTTLNTGQVYYRTSSDMTGVHITSDKPVALFAMNQSAQVPSGTPAADIFFQQLAPVTTWGKTFFAPVNHLGTEVIRIVASQNNTKITQIGAETVIGGLTLQAGKFCELRVPLSSGGCYIKADKPVGVCTYLTSIMQNFPFMGDPSQAWLPPVEQTVTTALMAPFIPNGKSAIEKHYALIVTPTLTRAATRVRIGSGADDDLIGGTWIENMDAKMSFYTVELTDVRSTYFFTNKEGLFVMAYGIGGTESYYYLASSSMRDLDVAFYVNDIHHQDLPLEIICKQPMEIRAEVGLPMSSIKGFLKWYIDGEEEIAARDQITWWKELPNGTYNIKMVVVLDDEGMSVKTVESVLKVGNPKLTLEDLTYCDGETARRISFTGENVTPALCTWAVTEGSGTAIGMTGNSGTGPIPAFLAVNKGEKDTVISITVIPKSADGCIGDTATFTITVFPQGGALASFNLGNDTTICWLDSLRLNGEHPQATHYKWQDNSTKTTYTVWQQAGKYWLTVSNMCSKAADTINISYLDNLTVHLGNDTVFCEGDVPLRLNATTLGAISYQWEDGANSPVYIVEKEGIYIVTVSNACMSVSDTIEVQIKNCTVKFKIPNVFTPNGDGMNDMFVPELTPPENVKDFQMFIYNRWGRLVFSTTNPQTLWSGNNEKGQPCSQGVYYCHLSFKDVSGIEYTHHGSITLIR